MPYLLAFRPDYSEKATQIKLFHGSEEVFTGAVLATTAAKESKGESIIAGGTVRLGSALPPGHFFLQVIVTDRLAPRAAQSSSQWIDFEIVK